MDISCNDMFVQMKFDIRNYRKLTDKELEYIHLMTEKQKTEIIYIYDVVLYSITEAVIECKELLE
jgi:hypothetical protein